VSQAFYRKWRPRTFDEVVGQNHVTQTLHNGVKSGRIVHAYLFSGPRGTGKTSTARILAKAVNCLSESDDKPCNVCQMCQAIDEGRLIDLIEIDAASNRGIDDIRNLRERIAFAPSEARYKFYIIDEVHMLTDPAFNALLKTLEEPPGHAILVLATTEPQEIPATVLSRCQRFDFRPIPLEAMIARLRAIAAQEGLGADEAALDLIARQATGSMRDAESLLDQLASYGGQEITLQRVQTMLGTVSHQGIANLVDHLATRDVAAGLDQIGQAVVDGADPRQLNKELLEYLRGLLLMKTTNAGPQYTTEEQRNQMARQAESFTLDSLVAIIKLFSQAAQDFRAAARPQLPLELAFVEATLSPELEREAAPTPQYSAPDKRPHEPTEERTTAAPPVEHSPSTTRPQADSQPKPSKVKESTAPPGEKGNVAPLERLQNSWTQILTAIKAKSMHLEAVIKDCPAAAVEDDVVTLRARSRFHKERLDEDRARQSVEEEISKIMGQPYRIKCILTSDMEQQQPQRPDDIESLAEDPVVRAGLDLGGKIGRIQ
jgi:DNA polymerase-3 subunit gamma/tau